MILKKLNFKVHKTENGLAAFNKVRNFIENYNKVRTKLQQPGVNLNGLKANEVKFL